MAGKIVRQEEMKEARSQKKVPAQMIQCFLGITRNHWEPLGIMDSYGKLWIVTSYG